MYDQIAPYYDSLYAGKDYEGECDFLETFFNNVETILDVGCGSGRHAGILAGRGYRLLGVDQSSGMIEKARENYPDTDFRVEDARSLEVDEPFDAAISLFGTMTYFDEMEDFKRVLTRLHRCIRPSGLLIFDGWNADAVTKATPPNGRLDRLSDDLLKYTEMVPRSSELSDSRLAVIDIAKGAIIDYKTPLRLFSRESTVRILEEVGFDLIAYSKAFAQVAPCDEDWKVSIVARRI